MQHSPSGNKGSTRYTLYCKGADSVLLGLCSASEENDAVKATAIEHAKTFAEQGLRTLVLAKKELGPDEAEMFLQELESARTSATQTKRSGLQDWADFCISSTSSRIAKGQPVEPDR